MDGTNFHSFYETHAKAVHRFALYLTGNRDEADEITAETFLRAWTASGPVQESTARAYLIAIARNVARDNGRRSRRETQLDFEWPAGGSSPHQLLEFGITLTALRGLPAELAEPLLMSAVEGWSYEEIAGALGTPLSTVKIRIHRARLRLAQELNRERSPR
jgi:RNA polymerase sigma-70 factor (ECF subfamily)